MKRVLIVLGVLGVVAVIAFLAVTRNMAQQRAAKLDKALIQAESRVLELEGDVQSLEEELEELKKAQSQPAPSAGTNAAVAPSPTPTATTQAPASGELVRYAAAGGTGFTNMVRIEGTSSVHDWRVVGTLIGGTVDLPQGFPETAATGAIQAKASAFIPVRSMKSLKEDGKPYSDAMDEIMYGKLLVQDNPRITFSLNSLQAKQGGDASAPYEAVGQLALAGKTNTITMPVSITRVAEGRLQVSGTAKTKMTDFGIEPPQPGPIRTGDEVTLRFTWTVKPASTSTAAK